MKTITRLIAAIIAAVFSLSGLVGCREEIDSQEIIFGTAPADSSEAPEAIPVDTTGYSASSYYAAAAFDAVEGSRIAVRTDIPYSPEGYESAKLLRTGKNMCPVDSFENSHMEKIDIPGVPAGVYSLSFDFVYSQLDSEKGTSALVVFKMTDGTTEKAYVKRTDHSGHRSIRVSITNPLTQIIAYSSDTAAASDNQTVTWTNIQLEALSHETGYEEYKGESFEVTFSEKIFGGEIDWNMGTLTSRFAADGTKLTEPSVISLAPQDIIALNGRNTVFCSIGETTAEYKRSPEADDYDCDINFWGDSLTYGGLSVTFPSACAEALGGVSYRNCGVGGEDSHEIAARMGAIRVFVPAPSDGKTINRDDYTLTDIVDEYGHRINLLRQGNGGATVNPVQINGDFCSLSISQASVTDNNAHYAISGYNGDTPNGQTEMVFSGSAARSRIAVIWAGTNDGIFNDPEKEAEKIDELIEVIDKMIEKADCPCLVLGLSVGDSEQNAACDAKMLEHYGDRFFNTREMLVEYGMERAGLTPTATDEAQLAVGRVPDSLRGENDPTHLNVYGYQALGEMVAEKITSLGWNSLIGK